MATIPSLRVNPLEKTASIIGSSTLITVNNIRRDKNYLLSLKPKDVERIEIIHHPSARYKNIGGIINIVTSGLPDKGHSGYLSARPELISFEQGYSDGGYTYIGEKVNVSLNTQYFFFDDVKQEESLERDVLIGDNTIHTERTTKSGASLFSNTYIGSNIDYTISPKTFVSAGLMYIYSPQSNEKPYKGKVASNDGEYEFDAHSKGKSYYNNYKTNLYYQTDFSKKSSMSIDIDYNFTRTKSNNLYTEHTNNILSYENRGVYSSDIHALTSQVNFQQQLPKVRLEEGYRLYYEDNPSDNEINRTFTRTEYERWLHYFYLSLLGKISEKWVYQVNAGFDVSQTTFNNERNTYVEFTPDAMLRYIMKNGQNITLNYSLSRKTPGASMLDPVPRFVDSSRIITGNPNLKPYYLHSFLLRHEYNKNRFYTKTSLSYSRADNIASNREYLDEQGIYHITYTNRWNYSSVALDYNLSFKIFQWWNVSANGSAKYYMYKNTDPEDNQMFHENFWQHTLWASTNVNYKKMSLSATYGHPFRNSTLHGYTKGNWESEVQVMYRLNNSWNILGALRYLTPLKSKIETYSNGFSEIYSSHMADRYLCVMLGIRYNFQKGKQQQYRQKKVKNYEDRVTGAAVTR
jgi:hypothetical protein